MKSPVSASALAILLTGVGVAGFNSSDTASADTETENRPMGPMAHHQEQRPEPLEDVTRTVTNLDNGVTITLTTDNADSLEKLQEMANGEHPRPHDESVEESITLLDNGVEITLTSDDVDVVERLQEHAAQEPGEGPGGGKGPNGPMHEPLEDVTRTVTNLDNGVTITLTTDNADSLEKLQAGPDNTEDRPQPENVTVEITNLDNGIQITITSDDPEEVERIQTRAEEGPRPMHGRHNKPFSSETESE